MQGEWGIQHQSQGQELQGKDQGKDIDCGLIKQSL